GKKVFTAALLGEIKKFREQRQLAQQRLREVRRKLREDKERLGEILFLINTFFIPFVLIVTSVVAALRKSRRPRQTTRFGESESNELIEESKA
ncbi:MAG TPA: hypothetical protein PLP17_07355, partial [Oligoflexia bacterium]|nr:hypothetical protein [Oligoflexia bacterium]